MSSCSSGSSRRVIGGRGLAQRSHTRRSSQGGGRRRRSTLGLSVIPIAATPAVSVGNHAEQESLLEEQKDSSFLFFPRQGLADKALHVILVHGPLGAHPPPQGPVFGRLGGDVAVAVLALELPNFLKAPLPTDFPLVVLRPNEIDGFQQFDLAFRQGGPLAARVPLFAFHPHLVDPNAQRVVFRKLLRDVGCGMNIIVETVKNDTQ